MSNFQNDGWREIESDVEYGLHSGIPACCVRFYVTEWTYGPTTRTKHPDKWDYVPCDECLKSGHKVRLVRCATDCKGLCKNELVVAGIRSKMRAYAHRLLEGYR